MSACGVCQQPATGTVPDSSLLDGNREIDGLGDLRLSVCVHHGQEHHHMWQAGWRP